MTLPMTLPTAAEKQTACGRPGLRSAGSRFTRPRL
jgi:hypothetical protein